MERYQLREIMNTYTEQLIRTAYYYTKDLQIAEDIVQEVFIKFYQKSSKYNEQGQLAAYLMRLTINQSKDYLKSWHVRKMTFLDKWSEQVQAEVFNDIVRSDEEELVATAILSLPIKHREPLVYYYFEEMSIPHISELLQIPQSTVKTRLTRAKHLLRIKLQGIEWEVLLNE